MRILLTSDLHYRLRQYDWVIRAAPQFDAVVIAGDHIDGMLSVPGEVQIAALSATLTTLAQKTRLFACSGNHDLNSRNAEGEKTADWLRALHSTTLAVDGDTVMVGDTLFTVCPWWDGPYGRSRVERSLETASRQRDGRWIWVYHAPPVGPLSWTGKRHFGDAGLTDLVNRYTPTAVMCGHIHEAPFRKGGSWIDRIGATLLFNAGHQIGDAPARIEIDFARLTARWISIEGVEEVALQ